jgi:hypothetical protein
MAKKYAFAAFCGAASAVLAWAMPAAAQDERHIDVELQARVVHDSNVARSSEALAALRGIDTEDTILSPTIVVDILVPVSRQSLFLRGLAARDYYQENSVLDSTRYDIDGGFNLRAGPCTGALTAGYQRRRSDLQDPNFLVVQNIESLKSANAQATCGRAIGFAPTVSVGRTEGENSALLLQDADFESTSASVGIAYRRPNFGQLTLFGRETTTEYPNRMITTGSGTIRDGYDLRAVGVRYERELGSRLEGSVSVSQTSVDPDNPGVPDFEGLTWGADLGYRPSSRLQTRLSFERQANPTLRTGAAYAIDETIELAATYGLGPRLELNAGVLRGTSRYEGAALSGNLTKEEISALYAGVRWELGRRVALDVDVRHEEREANLPGLDYTSNRIGAAAVAKF